VAAPKKTKAAPKRETAGKKPVKTKPKVVDTPQPAAALPVAKTKPKEAPKPKPAAIVAPPDEPELLEVVAAPAPWSAVEEKPPLTPPTEPKATASAARKEKKETAKKRRKPETEPSAPILGAAARGPRV